MLGLVIRCDHEQPVLMETKVIIEGSIAFAERLVPAPQHSFLLCSLQIQVSGK